MTTMSLTEQSRILRETATLMKEHHPTSHPRHEMWSEMAKLMEEAAKPIHDHDLLRHLAMPVAQAYCAAVGRPDLDGSLG
jgi:hypothetical protein